MTSQKFGGPWSLEKLKIVEEYLRPFCIALGSRFNLIYIDAFAGSGSFAFRGATAAPLLDEEEQIRSVDGSARVALSCTPPFSHLYFLEQKRKNVEALKGLAREFPHHKIDILKGNANELLSNVCQKVNWLNSRGILFLDPFGNSVEWKTLEFVARRTKLDVWYLFPLSGVYRNVPGNLEKLTEDKRASVTRILGTPEWEDYFYKPALDDHMDLFPEHEAGARRTANAEGILNYVSQRLSGLFPYVTEPRILQGPNNAPLYALYLALTNDSEKAIALAKRIARAE